MKEKIPLLDRLLPVDGRLPLDVLLIALLSAAAFTGPFATYVLNRRTYDFLGSYFLSGISVANNTVQINPVPMIFFFGLFILLAIAAAILSFRGRPHLGAWLTVLAGVLTMGWAVLTNTQLVNILDGLRTVNTGWGLNMLAVCGVLLIVRGMYSLRRLGTLCTLDFMAMPVGLYLLINNYFPMVGLFITFKNIDYRVGILNSPWCGFDNFSYLFATSDAWLITKNTLTYNFGFIVIGNLLGILIGLFLANLLNKRLQKLYQTVILLPQLISYVIVGYIVFAFLSNEAGFVTKMIEQEGSITNFYADRGVWPFILNIVYNWKQIGYSSVIYLAAISSIDVNLYEASSIDGAGRLQQIFKITLPMMRSTIITLVLLQIGRIFYSDFGLFYQVPMNSGMLFNVTQTIDTYVYRMLMTNNRISMASAASFYQSVVGLCLVLAANAVVRRVDRENALF